MRNPRLIIIGIVVIALLTAVAVGLLLGRSQASRANSASATFDEQTSVVATPTSGPSASASTPAQRVDPPSDSPTVPVRSDEPDGSDTTMRLVIKGFGKEFTNMDGGQGEWLRRLSPYANEAVHQDLATVDLDSVPVGHFAGYQILKTGEREVAARVTYREGWSTVLYLITDGSNWRVFRYDRFDE